VAAEEELTTHPHLEVQEIVQAPVVVEIQAEVVVVVEEVVLVRIPVAVAVALVVPVIDHQAHKHQLVPELLDKDILEVEADIVQAIVLVMVAQD
jgi:hypothetical protein